MRISDWSSDVCSSDLARAPQHPTLLVTHEGNQAARLQAYREAGVEVAQVATDADGHVSLDATLSLLGASGITRPLAEGGGHLSASLLRGVMVDRLAWSQSPMVYGAIGIMSRWERVRQSGEDSIVD